jgi:uncharacterized protein YndB with AHSA1/START domain
MPANQTTLELQGDREIVITRTFNGPPRIVFDAWTKPEHVMRWWAPKGLGTAMISVDADVRAGGHYRYVFRHRTGATLGFSGKYVEVTPPSRLVYTQLFEPTAGGAQPGDPEVVITVTFEERNGKTHLVSSSLCPTREIRDAIIATGMEKGMRETMDQLDELVAELR